MISLTISGQAGQPRPVALGNVAAVALDGHIFVPGGCDSDWIPQNIVHIYNPQTDAWMTAAPLPQPLCAYALAEFQEKVYLFGGWDGDAYTALGFVYDPAEDDWRPLRRQRLCVVLVVLLFLGIVFSTLGVMTDAVNWITARCITPTDDEWELCPPMLQPRGGIGVAATTGRLYVLGGGWDSFLGFNEQFSPESGQWTVMDTPIVGEWRNVGRVCLGTVALRYRRMGGD